MKQIDVFALQILSFHKQNALSPAHRFPTVKKMRGENEKNCRIPALIVL